MKRDEMGDLPQQCVYEAGRAVARNYYERLAKVQEEGALWTERFFVEGEDPRVDLAGSIAVIFDMDAGEKSLNVYEALADGSLALTEAEKQGIRGLRCGDVFNTVRTVKALMPAILAKADALFERIMRESGT